MPTVKRFHIYAIVAAALLVHLTVLHNIRIFGAQPDLILLSVIFFALFTPARSGLETGLVAGALKDLFAFDLFGVNTVILGMTGLLIGILNNRFLRESGATRGLLVFSFTIFSMLAHYAFFSIMSKNLNIALTDYLIAYAVPTGLYTTLASIPLFAILADIYKPRKIEDLL